MPLSNNAHGKKIIDVEPLIYPKSNLPLDKWTVK